MVNVLLKQSNSETITVSTTAIGFTGATAAGAVLAVCSVEDADIRVDCSNTPTSSKGIRIKNGQQFRVWGESDILGFKAIRDASTNATLQVLYYTVGEVYPWDIK